MTQFINLTSTDIRVCSGYGKTRSRSAGVATVTQKQVAPSNIAGIPVTSVEFTGVTGLPAAQDGVAYIVTLDVLQVLGGSRPDVVSPGADTRTTRDGLEVRSFIAGA